MIQMKTILTEDDEVNDIGVSSNNEKVGKGDLCDDDSSDDNEEWQYWKINFECFTIIIIINKLRLLFNLLKVKSKSL